MIMYNLFMSLSFGKEDLLIFINLYINRNLVNESVFWLER